VQLLRKEDGEKLQGEVGRPLTQVNAMQQAITELQAEKKKRRGPRQARQRSRAVKPRGGMTPISARRDDALQQSRRKGLVEGSTERLTDPESW
jgi:hypothetical protein